jgi:predicted tellurium resistance membrane protein TerC
MMGDIAEIIISLSTLTILEIVLGVDNLVFLAIISQRLPQHQQKRARRIGLTLAWVMRLILLASAVAITKLTRPLITIFGNAFSGRDIFLILGGLFLLVKATQEIHIEMTPDYFKEMPKTKASQFWGVIAQIALLDIIFSLDSVLTAIGLTPHFWLMAVAISIAILVMIFLSEPLSRFIEKHPTIKMLALSFLLLIGMMLIVDGFGVHVSRGYIYFAIGFSIFIESLNIAKTNIMNRKKKGS